MISAQLPPFSTLGIRFSRLGEVIDMLGGRDALIGKNTTAVSNEHLKPLTEASGMSLCDQLASQGGDLALFVAEGNWFISHAWSYQFLHVIEAITIFLETEKTKSDGRGEAVIWFDMFSNSQHATHSKPFEWWKDTFMNAVEKLGNVLMILHPWDKPIALTRAWCVIELLACESKNCRFEVSMSAEEAERFTLKMTEEGSIEHFRSMLINVDSSTSVSSNEDDTTQIHDAVRTLLPQGFTTLDSMVLRVFERWMVTIFKRKMASFEGTLEAFKWHFCLCKLLRFQGRFQDALEEALDCRKREAQFCCDCNVSIAMELSLLYLFTGNYAAAEPLLLECRDTLTHLYGPEHEKTLTCAHNLGKLYVTLGRYAAAEPLLLQCLEASDRVLGCDHPGSILHAVNLGELYERQGKFLAAEPLHQRSLRLSEQTLGPNHPSTLNRMTNLGNVYFSLGKFVAAEDLYQRSLEISERILGPDNPDTLISIDNLGKLYLAQGRYDAAVQMFLRYQDSLERCLGPGHPHSHL
jgi:hypothetical protein